MRIVEAPDLILEMAKELFVSMAKFLPVESTSSLVHSSVQLHQFWECYLGSDRAQLEERCIFVNLHREQAAHRRAQSILLFLGLGNRAGFEYDFELTFELELFH